MEYKFRDLRADEVNVRVDQVGQEKDGEIPWITCLLYKDARCDMDILDETVGPMNWQRHHSGDNANCVIAIWDEGKKQWVEKEDTGTESYAESEKGIASDSFKRSGTNWGIGRELYTAPLIFVPRIGKDGGENFKTKNAKGKLKPDVALVCTFLKVKNKKIIGINIENAKKRRTVFAWGELM